MEAKKLKKTVIIIAILGINGICHAQFNHVGIKTGVNISNVSYTNSDYSEMVGGIYPTDNQAGFTMGMVSQASGNGYMATSIGLFYTNTGFKVDDIYKLRVHSIKIPLEFRARIPIAGPVTLQLGMGPYVSYGFLGDQTALDTNGRSIKNLDVLSLRSKNEKGTFSDGELKEYNRFDGGIIFGGEVEIKLPNEAFLLVGFNYEFGVAKISNEWEAYDMNNTDPTADPVWINPGIRNRVMCITVSYMFDVTDKKNKKKP